MPYRIQLPPSDGLVADRGTSPGSSPIPPTPVTVVTLVTERVCSSDSDPVEEAPVLQLRVLKPFRFTIPEPDGRLFVHTRPGTLMDPRPEVDTAAILQYAPDAVEPVLVRPPRRGRMSRVGGNP